MVSNDYSDVLPALLGDGRMSRIHLFDCVDSTNRIAKDMLSDGAPDGTVIIADSQTNGRGRLSRSFLSPADSGIYLSYIIRPDSMTDSISSVTAWTAVAAANAVESVCGLRPGIKWVNDLVMNNKKICGILCELCHAADKSIGIIIGIGVNVTAKDEDFPPELRRIASSISAQTGRSVSRTELAAQLIKELDIMRGHWPDSGRKYLELYRRDCITLGKDVIVTSGDNRKKAFALAVNDDFSLSVRFEDMTTQDISFGEVSVRGMCGYS
ncbi:MAG: biotin--[Clostridia bacterium]|nr:biotin--[acetyl-CoA-carboxylase] ligase [Clostridia bacterium]